MAWHVRSGLNGAIPITLRIDSPVQRVGQKGAYAIIGAPPNAAIYWSSYKDGVATGELNASYGHTTEANGTAEISMSAPWSDTEIGSWIKEILVKDVNGQTYTAMTAFSVYPAVQGPTATGESSASDNLLTSSFQIGGLSIPLWAPIAAIAAFALWRK